VVNNWAGTVSDFLIGLTCYPDGSKHRFITCCWRKSYQKCWRKSDCQSRETCGSSTMGLQLTLHVRSKNISPLLTTFTGLDRAGQWLGLPGHWTSHHIKALIYTSPVDSEEDRTALLLRQYQPSGNNLTFLSIHVSRCYVIVGCVSSSAAIRFNICSFWKEILFFLRIFQWFASFPTLIWWSTALQGCISDM
jgi:hypothetical protein